MGATYQGVGKRGCGFLDLGKDERGSGPSSFTVWVRDVGDDAMHWGFFRRIPSQGVPQDDGTATVDGG